MSYAFIGRYILVSLVFAEILLLIAKLVINVNKTNIYKDYILLEQNFDTYRLKNTRNN